MDEALRLPTVLLFRRKNVYLSSFELYSTCSSPNVQFITIDNYTLNHAQVESFEKDGFFTKLVSWQAVSERREKTIATRVQPLEFSPWKKHFPLECLHSLYVLG